MAKVTVMRVDDESNIIPRHYAAMKVSRSVADRILSFTPGAIRGKDILGSILLHWAAAENNADPITHKCIFRSSHRKIQSCQISPSL